MTTPSPHLDDEALSAAADGLAGAGVDHLEDCEACRARRDQLVSAREALRAAAVEPVDDLTRRRMIARALEAGPAPTARPWYLRPVLGGVAAAVLAVLVALPFLLDRQDRSTDLAATGSSESAAPFLGDLGDVSDPTALRAALAGPAAAGTASDTARRDAVAGQTAPKAATPAPAPPVSVAPTGESYALRTGSRSQTDSADAQRCAAQVLAGEAKGTRLTATGTGSYRGRPAVVVAVTDDRSGTRTAFVVAADDCRVLDRQRLGAP